MDDEDLDGQITEKEVRESLSHIGLGKSPGIDGIVPEILRKGGEEMFRCVFELCSFVWEKEEIPKDWTRGIIFPILKDGDKRDTENYRGITLLSVVGKIYTHVLNTRLSKWLEKNKILEEEQSGFRGGRGCVDQLFTLVEILKNRGKKGTFCCFLDVRKAFDRVFRDGLWYKLYEEGVQGKMWRVLRNIYRKVESCVLVGGELSDWINVETGVRQGCVLSPLLYSIFINGLIKKLKSSGLGVKVSGEVTLECLFFADDIVLISENKENLQKLLDIVDKYSRKWRFEINPKKSEIVIFGLRDPPRNLTLGLGEHKLKTTGVYKYLGVELTRTLRWKKYTDVQDLGYGSDGRVGNKNFGSSLQKFGSFGFGVRV